VDRYRSVRSHVVVRVFRATCDILRVAHVTEAQCGGWGMPKALTYGVHNLSRVYMQKDRGYLDDKVTQYFHNGVLASAGQKRQCERVHFLFVDYNY
jgi:hypothetical protein